MATIDHATILASLKAATQQYTQENYLHYITHILGQYEAVKHLSDRCLQATPSNGIDGYKEIDWDN